MSFHTASTPSGRSALPIAVAATRKSGQSHAQSSRLTIKGGDASATARSCNHLIHRLSKRRVKVALTELPSCPETRVAEDVVQKRLLGFVQPIGHATVTMM